MEAISRKFDELHISIESIGHAPAMTADEQMQALGDLADTCTKNLFLQDKRGRLYLVTALAGTEVNLKGLAARLGLGKSLLRLAPEALVGSLLRVPLGSVTPLALCQPGAAGVVLLVDAGIQGRDRVAVHPLANTASVLIAPSDLEALLRSFGVEPHFVDLAAEPQIDRDNPPDLKALADAAPTLVKEEAGDVAAAAAEAGGAAAAKPAAPAAGGGGGKKKDKGKTAGCPSAAAAAPAGPRGDDVQRAADAILERVQKGEAEAAAAGGGKSSSSGLAALGAEALRRLRADLAMELNALRNAAYARGFKAARTGVVSSITGQYVA